LNQILKRQTSRSHYGSKVPAVTITVFKYRNKIGYARDSSNYSDFLKRHLHLRNRLLDQGYKQLMVNHSAGQYVNGIVHTNGIESVWALLRLDWSPEQVCGWLDANNIIKLHHEVSIVIC
jgi:hypothetical protein